MIDIADGFHTLSVIEALTGNLSRATLLRAAATTLQKRIGFTYPDNDPIFRLAPATWLQTAPSSHEWTQGEIMPLNQAVAHALGLEME